MSQRQVADVAVPVPERLQEHDTGRGRDQVRVRQHHALHKEIFFKWMLYTHIHNYIYIYIRYGTDDPVKGTEF